MHPNKKRKPKHTAVFRYNDLGYSAIAGASRRCKAVSMNHMKLQGCDFKYNGYETYSKTILQEIKYVYTAQEPRKRGRV